jgi:RHS repeat-associated protein
MIVLDDADQRYYNPWFGRFNTPDPSAATVAEPANPASWNMYALCERRSGKPQ